MVCVASLSLSSGSMFKQLSWMNKKWVKFFSGFGDCPGGIANAACFSRILLFFSSSPLLLLLLPRLHRLLPTQIHTQTCCCYCYCFLLPVALFKTVSHLRLLECILTNQYCSINEEPASTTTSPTSDQTVPMVRVNSSSLD